jgi:hypothetical protein
MRNVDTEAVPAGLWLDRYLKRSGSADRRLRARRWSYLEPVGNGVWSPVQLRRADRSSFYYCSGWDMHGLRGRHRVRVDVGGVGCTS